MEQLHRYPGSSPFTREYKDLFFGRDKDLEDLYKQLFVHKLTVLYGKSGLGKSSLLNAGLIPKMEAEPNQFVSVVVRFGGYSPGGDQTPEEIFLRRIRELSDAEAFLEVIEPNPDTMWQVFKQFEWKHRDKKGIFLVLDQFEEVFTYPDAVETFALRFSELLNNRMPEDFRKNLYAHIQQDPEFLKNNTAAVNFTEQSPNLKILIGIRSDKLSLLDRFSAQVPYILKNCYELLPLGAAQAREAIERPAAENRRGPYFTHPFRYSEDALKEILAFLTHDNERAVEPFLLQIICQHAESLALRNDGNPAPNPPFTVEPALLGDLDAITRLYYVNALHANDEAGLPLFNAFERLNIRFLIERNLIESRSRVRVTLDKNLVEKKGISADLIERIVNTRLVRREPNAVSGQSYELSHDTLVDPILQAHELLGNFDDAALAFYNAAFIPLLPEFDLETLQEFIETQLIDKQGQPRSVSPDQLDAADRAAADALLRAGLVRRESGADGKIALELYHLFLLPALTLRAERGEKALQDKETKLAVAESTSAEAQKKRRQAVVVAVGAVILSLIAILASIIAFEQSQMAQAAVLEARSARQAAEKNTYLAEVNWHKAEAEQIKADSLARLAEQKKEIALANAREAFQQRSLAIVNAKRAEKALALAEQARISALLALKEADQSAAQARQSEQFAISEKNRSDSLTLQLKVEGDSLKAARFRLEQLAQVKDARANTARSYELTALAFQYLQQDPALALRLAEAALQKADSELARRALLDSWYAGAHGPSIYPLSGNTNQPHKPNGPYQIQINNGTIQLRDSKNQLVQSFSDPQNPKKAPMSVAFTLDDQYLVAQYANDHILYWPLTPDSIIAAANEFGVRRLTRAERVRFNIADQ